MTEFITPEFKSFYEGYMKLAGKESVEKFKSENPYGYIFDIYDANKNSLTELSLVALSVSERMCLLLVIVNEAIIDNPLREFLKTFKPELTAMKEFNKPSVKKETPTYYTAFTNDKKQ